MTGTRSKCVCGVGIVFDVVVFVDVAVVVVLSVVGLKGLNHFW